MQLTSIEFSEKRLNKYVSLLKRHIVSKRFDELNTTYNLTGEFDITANELNGIFKKAEREGIYICLQRKGKTIKNSSRNCYFFSFFYSFLPLIIALLLTVASFILVKKNIVPEYVFSGFILATFLEFMFITLTDIFRRVERQQMIDNDKKL